MRVVVGQPGKGYQRGPQVDVIGEEVLGLRDPKVAHPGSDHPDEGPPNLRLNIAVVLGVAGKHGCIGVRGLVQSNRRPPEASATS